MGFFENIMKIVSYFQFSLIISQFRMILKERMIVQISNICIAKASVF